MRNEEFISLGHNTKSEFNYCPDLLEKFENRFQDSGYCIQIKCSEFTSLCPVTGQADFATVHILYVPDKNCVESKSLKLSLSSFRNHRDFNEDISNMIIFDLIELLDPFYIEVSLDFFQRGGIAISPFVNYGRKDTKYERMAAIRLSLHDVCDIMQVDFRKIDKIDLI